MGCVDRDRDATGSPATSTIQLNPDGSTRSQMDADGSA
jgi:hypothetical protein